MKILMLKWERFCLLICYCFVSSIFILWLFSLLWNIQTLQSTLIVLTFVWIWYVPILLILTRKIHKVFLSFVILGSIFSFCCSFAPNQAIDGRYELRSLNEGHYNFNILNGISEREFLRTGYFLAKFLGITKSQLATFQAKELQYEATYPIHLPSQIPNALINKKEQKYILYTPDVHSTQNLIIVLHWNAWWFLFYQKYFKGIADEYQAKVAMPIWGWGNWNEDGGTDLVFHTYEDLLKRNEITPKTHITLIGFSNGGKWLTRSVYHDEKHIFSSVVSISWVLEDSIIKQETFQTNAKNINFLLIQGKKDDRVLYKYFVKSFPFIPNTRAIIFPNWDHFIGISQDSIIQDSIKKIISSHLTKYH